MNGLTIEASGVVVAGLAIESFTGSGLRIDGGGGSRIDQDVIGTGDPTAPQIGNGGDGVTIVGSSNNTIGGPTSTTFNLISGNGGNGVTIEGGASGNVVENDEIGLDDAASGASPNSGDGVAILDSPDNRWEGRRTYRRITSSPATWATGS